MSIEIEVKIPVDDFTFNKIASDSRNGGLVPIFHRQRNIIYYNGAGFFRVRYEAGKIIFTAKGKNSGNGINMREEIESVMENTDSLFFEDLKRLAEGSSFYYEKNRANIHLGDCVLSLDELSDGRKFIEIEGSEEAIKKYIKHFGLEGRFLEKRSYSEILGAVK